MIRVKIIALGKLKEAYLRDAAAEYEKRLRGYCTFDFTELTPKALPENPNDSQIEKALLGEAEMILKAMKILKWLYNMFDYVEHNSLQI